MAEGNHTAIDASRYGVKIVFHIGNVIFLRAKEIIVSTNELMSSAPLLSTSGIYNRAAD